MIGRHIQSIYKLKKDNFMKTKKAFAAIIAVFILLGLVLGTVYFNKTYAKINGSIYKTDVKEIHTNLRYDKIKEINKCTEVEDMLVSNANEGDISNFRDFGELSQLYLSCSEVNNSDSRKISAFSNLRELYLYLTDIDFEGFDNNNLSTIITLNSNIKNFNSLADCLSLNSIEIIDSAIDDSIIYSNRKCVMKDSGFLSSFDNITELTIDVYSIEDVSGICEMDSLQKLTVNSDSISDEQKSSLEDSGIKVTLKEDTTHCEK